MRVIVSKSIKSAFEKYTVVDNLVCMRDYSDIEAIIIHSFTDDIKRVGGFIDEYGKKWGCKFYYICAEPDELIKLWIEGAGGAYVSDTFYFDGGDESELDGLVESEFSLVRYDEKNMLSVVDEFVSITENTGALPPYYIERAKEAVAVCRLALALKDEGVRRISSEFTQLLNEALRYIEKTNAMCLQARERVNELEEQSRNTPGQKPLSPRERVSLSGGASVVFYPSFSYDVKVNQKAVVIREYAPCRYLTSFLLAYRSYLENKGRRAKLIFVIQKGSLLFRKYNMFSFVCDESKDTQKVYTSDIIATNIPQKQVMSNLFEQSEKYDVLIIADRLYSGEKPIVQGAGVQQLCAVSGASDLERYRLNAKNCIFPITEYNGCFLTIPSIQPYAPVSDVDKRKALYARVGSQGLFGTMDTRLGLS